jgi:iron complex transport system ATP-binding protein
LILRCAHKREGTPGSFERYSTGDHRLAAAALRPVGTLHLADRGFGSLSGGEKQRVMVARTLAQEADHLLLDEPTNHLDIRYQREVLGLVRGLGCRRSWCSVLRAESLDAM